MLLSGFPRVSLAHLPTRLEFLPRLTEQLGGPEIWVKRDDCTGLATGGNKTRKLEYLIADALAARAGVVLTVGAPQSNHCRQTAAAAARAGLECVLVLRGAAIARDRWDGNLLLDDLLGARLWWAGDRDPLDALEHAADGVAELVLEGDPAHRVPDDEAGAVLARRQRQLEAPALAGLARAHLALGLFPKDAENRLVGRPALRRGRRGDVVLVVEVGIGVLVRLCRVVFLHRVFVDERRRRGFAG